MSATKKSKQPDPDDPDPIGKAEREAVAAILDILAESPPQTKADLRRGFQMRLTKGSIPVSRLHYSVLPERDPEINPAWKEAERRAYTSQAAWDREQEIVDAAGGGELVFADTLITYWKKIVITDPKWEPDPDWRVEGGFDHGKTNPTALLRAYHGFDGTIYFAGEYYQPGREVWEHAPAIKKMRDFDRMETVYADPTIFAVTSQQSQRPGEAVQRAKSIGELYYEQRIENFVPFGGDRSDVSFAQRLHAHWSDLEHREPTVKIVCRSYSETPQFGLHQWDCPNLLWELMRARRVKLTAQQLMTRNMSEAIIDKDNHAVDAMKYELLSHPEPSRKSLERRVNDRLAELQKVDPVTQRPKMDATTLVANFHKIVAEERDDEDDEPSYCGGNVRRRFAQLKRQGRRRRF